MIKPDLNIFDRDGILVDSEILSCRCLSELLARLFLYGIGDCHYRSRDRRTGLYNAGVDRVFGRTADFWPKQAEGLDGRA